MNQDDQQVKRGRVRNVIPSVRWRAEIREDIANKVDLFLYDPSLGKIAYGARSNLLNTLLTQWLNERAPQPTTITSNSVTDTERTVGITLEMAKHAFKEILSKNNINIDIELSLNEPHIAKEVKLLLEKARLYDEERSKK